MLFRRYASPFLLMEQMLKCGRFAEWVDELLKMHNKDINDQTMWEWYLHHTWLDKSYNEFRRQVGVDVQETTAPAPEKADFKTVFSNTASILNSFVPED